MPTANVQKASSFPVNVPEVGSQNDPAYRSAHGSYISHKGRLVPGSNIKSCQTPAERDNQENIINFKPSASVPKYDVSGFGQPSVHYGSRTATDAFKNVQPSGRLASTSYQGGSTLMRTQPQLLKPWNTGTSGSQHGLSKWRQSTNKVQTASSSYGPFQRGTPLYSSINPRKLSGSEVKSSVVSLGPIFIAQDRGSAQGHDDPYQASQTSTALTASNQGKSWNEPLHYSMRGPELRKPSQNTCRDHVDRSSISSSGEVLRNKLPPHSKFQQTYNFNGQPSQNYNPTYPSQSWAQHNVAKSSIASSGAIRIMQGPTNVQSTPESNKPKVNPSFSFSSVSGTSHKPNSRLSKPSRSEFGFSAADPNIAGANKINTVHVRPNKPPTSSFGTSQNRGASGGVCRGSFQSSPPCSVGQRQGQNVHTPIGSSPQYFGSKEVKSQFTASQGNPDYARHINAPPREFGQGPVRRVLPVLPSNYRQGLLKCTAVIISNDFQS